MIDMAWSDLGVALGLVLVIEGAAFALFAGQMKAMMRVFFETDERYIRLIALILLATGLTIVWIIRS